MLDPDEHEQLEFVNLIAKVKAHIRGVLLYSTARNPALPEGYTISQVDEIFLAQLAARIQLHGIEVKYYR